MRYVVEIEFDTDTSLKTAKDWKVFQQFDDAANLFRHLNYLYQKVQPVGVNGQLTVVGGQIFRANANSDSEAIEEVKSGLAFLINDVTIADIPILSEILPD